jgi:hypothetical protein
VLARRRAVGALLALSSLLLTGCVSQDLAFRVDDRLTIVAPRDRAEVTLPVTVRWTMRDFRVVRRGAEAPSRNAGYFGVFVDATPQPPGKPVEWVARKDTRCREADGCPDAAYLAGRGIYTTTDSSITFAQLPRPSDEKRKERHEVTIVLLDTAGHRIGESAFRVAFVVDRTSS